MSMGAYSRILADKVETGVTGSTANVEVTLNEEFGYSAKYTAVSNGDYAELVINGGDSNPQVVAQATDGTNLSSIAVMKNGVEIYTNRLNVKNIPISDIGLSSGDVWNDNGTLKIVA